MERAFPDLAQILNGVESASGRIGDVEVQLIVVHRAHPDQNEGQDVDDRAVNLKPEWRYLFQEIHFYQTLRCLKPLKKNSRLPMMISKMAKVCVYSCAHMRPVALGGEPQAPSYSAAPLRPGSMPQICLDWM